MVFSSLIFLFIFLPLNLFLYYSTRNKLWRNISLIAISLCFYGWGEPIWISLLIFSAIVDYANARFIDKYRGTKWAKIGIVSTLTINLGLLATFKYNAFIVDNANSLMHSLGVDTHFTAPGYGLPIGISFYTFQTISYVVDVYRGTVKSQKSFIKFLMFVSLYFPLVAGPIVRYAHVANEIENRNETVSDFSKGIWRFCIGLFKKVILSNFAALLVKKYMGDNTDPLTLSELSSLSTGGAWVGLCMYALHIYFDFSGYSDMAIGLARMFGFHIHENFKYPYTATSATDFWRRWHISLGSFFRDYLYFPLGGNRKYVYRNLFIVWFLTGLWHGPSWNFIFWGLYFFVFISIEKAFLLRWLEKIPRFISHIYALIIIVPGWVIFYFTDTSVLWGYIQKLFSFGSPNGWNADITNDITENLYWIILSIIICLPVYHKVKDGLELRMKKPAYFGILSIAMSLVFLFLSVAYLVGKSYNPFIYFRF
jgi:alginate O-acetyltransferase complex protein AlgI